MHPHLHTKDNTGCTEVMNALEECHANGFIWKSLGMCNDAKIALNQCLKGERSKRVSANQSATQQKNREIRAKWKEIEENS